MIKGKTLIELTDVKTGKVERFEDNNMLTNAIDLYTSMVAAYCARFSSEAFSNTSKLLPSFPISDGIIGGIKLFQNTIEENANNYIMPSLADNPVIGYASSDTSDGTDTKRGSRNIAETTALENGMQIVWDFATSEANGTISCVCLTSGLGGKGWYLDINYLSNGGGNIGTAILGVPVSFDKETNILTTMSTSGNLTIRKYKLEMVNLSLDAIPYSYKLIDEQVKEETNTIQYWRDSGMGFWYYISSYSTSGTIKYKKMDKTTFAVSEVTVTVSGLSLASLNAAKVNCAIKNGYLYLQDSTYYKIYKVDLSNTSNITTLELPTLGTKCFYNYHICPLENNLLLTNGIIVDSNGGGNIVIDPDFNTNYEKMYNLYVRPSYGGSLNNCFEGHGFKIYDWYYDGQYVSDRRIGIEFDHTMLMSINNLEAPVTKTADKTMKITYTLTYTQ